MPLWLNIKLYFAIIMSMGRKNIQHQTTKFLVKNGILFLHAEQQHNYLDG